MVSLDREVTNAFHCPFLPNREQVGDLILIAHVPYSDSSVTIQINPGVVRTVDQESSNVRQTAFIKSGPETKILSFDFAKNKVQQVMLNQKQHMIELLKIGKTQMQGQNFPTFTFRIVQQE